MDRGTSVMLQSYTAHLERVLEFSDTRGVFETKAEINCVCAYHVKAFAQPTAGPERR